MIRFACPHCGKQYTVDDKLSGRHGWCALCMGLLAVPPADDPAQSRELSPEEKLEYLRGLLKAAEDRFNTYKDRFQKTDRLARALYQRRKALEGDLNEQGQRIASQTGRIEEALAQSLRLTQELEASARARGEAEALLARAREDVERLQSELQAEQQARVLAEEALRALPEVAPLEMEKDRLASQLDAERAARTEAEHHRQAAELQAAALEGQLRRAEEELERLRPQVAQGQALEGHIERLERDLAALREAHGQTVQSLGAAEARAQQAAAELERQQYLMETPAAPAPSNLAAEPNGELERLREELRDERTARMELAKLEREKELRAAQSLREAEQHRAHTEAVELAMAETERAYAETAARAERLAGELEITRRDLERARHDAKNAAELESGLRVSLARAEELHKANEVLASEVSLTARTAGAAEARIEELSRELERLAKDLDEERTLRREADERARDMSDELRQVESRLAEALRDAEKAEQRAAAKPSFAAPPRAEVDDVNMTLIPELVDSPEANDLMMDTLLRFIEPE